MTADESPDGRPPFTEATTDYWQALLSADHPAAAAGPPFRFGFPAKLPDGRVLVLPIRPVPDGSRAAASFIANHAAFPVIDALCGVMADLAGNTGGDLVVGLPTLGLALAPDVSRRLGHPHYVPLGYSRKFWYREEYSQDVSSFTTPGGMKKLYVDPNLLPRLRKRKIILVDDAISSGRTIVSALRLLSRLDCHLAGIVVAMKQGVQWQRTLADEAGIGADRVKGVFTSPLLAPTAEGWVPVDAQG